MGFQLPTSLNCCQIFEKIPQEAVVHEIKDSSTGKKDLQRMAEWEGQYLWDENFPRDGVGWIFWCPAIFFWNVFSIRSDICWIEKVEGFVSYMLSFC